MRRATSGGRGVIPELPGTEFARTRVLRQLDPTATASQVGGHNINGALCVRGRAL